MQSVGNGNGSTQQSFEEFKQLYQIINKDFLRSRANNENQQAIYREIIKIFHVFSKDLQNISSRINDEILKAGNSFQSQVHLENSNSFNEFQNNTYQYLSNSLLRLGECSRRVTVKCSNEILEPYKLFTENYINLGQEEIKRLQVRINNIKLHMEELEKQRNSYRMAHERLQKQKEQQVKMMLKMENLSSGNVVNNDKVEESQKQLIKFNNNLKKLIESIGTYEKFYIGSVEKLNYEWSETKNDLEKVHVSLAYNQESRNSFCRKNAINCIKTLEEFHNAIDAQIEKKLEQNSKQSSISKEDILNSQRPITLRIRNLTEKDIEESFESYEDEQKRLKKEANLVEQTHLVEIFNKVSSEDKKLIQKLVSVWFVENEGKKSKHVESERKSSTSLSEQGNQRQSQNEEEAQQINEKFRAKLHKVVVERQHYSFYFVEMIYLRVIEMSSFYCKLDEENFLWLCQVLSEIVKGIDMIDNRSRYASLNTEFLYKVIVASQRLIKKKTNHSSSGSSTSSKSIEEIKLKKLGSGLDGTHSIELASQYLGRHAKEKFNNPNLLKRLFEYILSRRQKKKRDQKGEKGVMSTLTKGLFGFGGVFSKKEDESPNQDEQFSCLLELANIISNLQVPTDTSLPFIKNTLKSLGNSNEATFEYLKSIILAKNDIQERKKIFYKNEVKEKLERQLKEVRQKGRVGSFCLDLTAKKGYLTLDEIHLRVLCRDLRNVHQHILYNLDMPTSLKWPRVVPFDPKTEQLLSENSSNKVANKKRTPSKPIASETEIDQIISLDVNRSLHIHLETLKPEMLTKLLKTYATNHKEIGYCQGMNYIAGYLYIKCGDFDSTYRVFEYLMERNFKELFINEFEVLKTKMYQFERLLAIYHPEISEHFKRQSILTECYMISWIITVFSSSYQYTMESYLIDFVWERFILWGWKEFFKFVLWIFGIHKEELIEMTYDKALHFFGDLVKGKFFLSDYKNYCELGFEQKYGDVRKDIEQYRHVSDELLLKLQKEYFLM